MTSSPHSVTNGRRGLRRKLQPAVDRTIGEAEDFHVRKNEPARRTGCAGEASVQGRERLLQRFGDGNVPAVEARDVSAQSPHAPGKRLERQQGQIEAQEVVKRRRCIARLRLPGLFQPTQDTRRLDEREMRREEFSLRHDSFGPRTVAAAVDQRRDENRGVDHHQRCRSASRACRISLRRSRVDVVRLRSRTSPSQLSIVGRDAIRSSSWRRYSCIDCRARAALAESSSRTCSGTSRIVICTPMTPRWARCWHHASTAEVAPVFGRVPSGCRTGSPDTTKPVPVCTGHAASGFRSRAVQGYR